MHKCVKQNIIVHFIIQNLKNKHTFLKKLSSLLFEESLFIFQVLNSQLDHPFRTSANFHDFWVLDYWEGSIWFLNPLVLSKWEDLAFSVCMLFEESVFIFQVLNNKTHKCIEQNIIVHFIIQKLKNKHTFLKTEKAKSSHFDRTRGYKNQIFPT